MARLLFLFLLVISSASWAQPRLPRGLGDSSGENEGEPGVYRPALAGIHTMVLSSVPPPGPVKNCSSQRGLEKLIRHTFSEQEGAPKLVKGSEGQKLPIFEVWFELPEQNPELFQAQTIPNELFAFALQMRVTTFSETNENNSQKFSSNMALEGNSIWWGGEKECKKGVEIAVNALLSRFFAEYRTANPGSRLPKQ